MATIKRAVPITLLAVAVVALPISAYQSRLTLINNVMNLNLTAAALGVLSTLNMYYFIGLSATLASLALSIRYRSNALTIISAFLIVVYFVDYPLLLSPFPPYLPDGTLYATESLAVSLFGYSNIAKWLYNGGAYPIAFIWAAVTSMVLGVQPIYLSSAYGMLEPIALGLISYVIGRRMVNSDDKNIALAPLAILIFTALIWSNQFHFSPQDFNIVVLMLIAPLLPIVVGGDLRAIVLISLATVTLTLGHQTEDPILLATLFSLLVLRIIRRYREFRSLELTTLVVTAMSFIMYSSYIIPANISAISGLFSSTAIIRLVNLLIGRVSHAVYFAATSYSSVYPLRSVVYKYELYGGYAMALFELVSIVALYVSLWFKESDNYRQAYASLALGGLLVDALITLAIGTYSNRIAIYSAPILSGLLLPYLLRIRSGVKYLVIPLLVALSFIGLIVSGSTIYWDYSAGNPITYQSYSIIYSLGYHYNFGSYYTANWLTYYQVINYIRNINTTKVFLYPGSLFDYNKNDLFYLANDVSLGRYQDALHDIANSTVIYNDGINIITNLK
ncbi:MAG: hypothetical protein RRB51_07575 [Thermoproteus sp.]|jgi:hypothetical protein|nr:hypothetical protein [Thermoproteus sp.]